MARMLGVDANRTIAAAFAITGAMTGLIGIVLVSRTGTVSPTVGALPVLIAFVGVVIGGMGTLTGRPSEAFCWGRPSP